MTLNDEFIYMSKNNVVSDLHECNFYSHYIVFILLPLVLTGLAAIGLPKIEYEDDFLKMWLPKDNYHRTDSGNNYIVVSCKSQRF